MEKKLQVFISSTFTDLKEERQKCVEAILYADHIPAGMELFKAGDKSQKELIKRWISESDVYMLILGGRYGTIDPESSLSYTHWEYNYACELEIPIFSIVLDDNYLNNKIKMGKLRVTDIETSDPKYIIFRKIVLSRIVRYINNIEEIKSEVMGAMRDIEKNNSDLKGWVRQDLRKNKEVEYILLINSRNIEDSEEYNKMVSEVTSLNRLLYPTSKNTPTRPYFEKRDEFRSIIIFIIKAPTLYFAEERRKQFEFILNKYSWVISCEIDIFKGFKELEKLL